jgi:DNA-binding NarL/FixJ family response regulator
VEENYFAMQYLRMILHRNEKIRAWSLSGLYAEASPQSLLPVFVLDNRGLTLPLTEYILRFRVQFPGSKYIVLDQDRSSEDVVRLLWLGIHGFLTYPEVERFLVEAILTVSEEKMWIPRHIIQIYVERTAWARSATETGREVLTAREYQITEFVKRRFSNKEIAAILHIRESTIKFHLTNAFSKLQVANRRDLLRKHEAVSTLENFILPSASIIP